MKEGWLDSRDHVIQGWEEGRGMASSLNHHTFDSAEAENRNGSGESQGQKCGRDLIMPPACQHKECHFVSKEKGTLRVFG